ncbi:DUF1648 domain-containing protein [Streptomyces sp. NPDC017529]|uniref:DUF1648 domain-containing protein n=1 Tax=Streptomyces sp. NPDC017529 TaxID=3365000 RepID=UPI00378F62E6
MGKGCFMDAVHAGPASGRPAFRPGRALIAVLPFLLAVAVVTAVFWALRDRLPDPLAVHFTAGGNSDNFASPADFLMMWLGMPVVFGAVIGALVLRDAAAGALRWAISVGYGLAALFGYLGVVTLLGNADTGDAAAVRIPLWHLGATLGVALLAGAVGRLCAGRDHVRADAVPGPSEAVPSLALADGESAGWSRTVNSSALLALGPGFLAVALLIGVTASWAGAACMALASLICVAFASVRVTVDRHGLTVASPLVSRPRLRIPLGRVEEAGTQQVSPLRDFGGWGYRIRSGRSGIVLRSGEALALRLAGGRVFVVTVDDAATAAALLNALAGRYRTGAGPSADRAHDPGRGV